MIRLFIIGSPPSMETLRAKGPAIMTTMTDKMLDMMIEFQARVVNESIPEFFPQGAKDITASVRAYPPVSEAIGNLVHGHIEAGGPLTTKETLGGPNAGRAVDYAYVQHEGVPHSWEIQPVFYASAQIVSLKKRVQSKVKIGNYERQGLPRFLQFTVGGQKLYRRRVLHPPLGSRPFMMAELENMESKIFYELQKSLNEVLNGES